MRHLATALRYHAAPLALASIALAAIILAGLLGP